MDLVSFRFVSLFFNWVLLFLSLDSVTTSRRYFYSRERVGIVLTQR